MSAFKIGGSLFRPSPGVSGGKKQEGKAPAENAAPQKNGFDTVKLNKLAVMPRMSSMTGQGAERLQSEAVEALLKDSAAEMDDYFTEAYGFRD